MKQIWNCSVPIAFALLAFITYFGDPNERILFAIPIVPGAHKNLHALAFVIASVFFAYSVFRHQKNSHAKQP